MSSVEAGALVARLENEVGAESVHVRHEPSWSRDFPVAMPASRAELASLLSLAASDHLRVLPLGGGGKLTWCPAPDRIDFGIGTRRLGGAVEYEPGDGTVTAPAGTSMAELTETVHAGGHHLTPDVPDPSNASLGGVIAASQSGFDRLRTGPLRHHVLGLSVMGPDGVVTRCGGRLVKNVTGFELQRLYTGSFGGLGVILEASLRLFPLPRTSAVVQAEVADRTTAEAVCRELLAQLWQPHAVVWEETRGSCRVHAAITGRDEQVAVDTERARALLPGAEVRVADEAINALKALRDHSTDGGWPALTLTARPSRISTALTELEPHLGPDQELLAHPGLARVDIRSRAGVDGADLDHVTIGALRERLAPLGARLLVPGAPSVAAPADARGKLLERIHQALDPSGRFVKLESGGGA